MATRALDARLDTRSRRYDPAETRQRVLAAANMLFSSRGFSSTGTADIAREADVSEGSIFYHFGSKQNLLVELGRRYGETMIAVMQGNDALEDLEPGVMIERCVTWCIEHRDWEALTGEVCVEGKPKKLMSADGEPFYREARHTTVDWVQRQMHAVLDKRPGHTIDIPVAASFTFVVVGEAIEATLNNADPASRATVLAEAIRFVRAACGYATPA